MKGNIVSFTSAEEVIMQCDYYMMKKRGKNILPIRKIAQVYSKYNIYSYIYVQVSLLYILYICSRGAYPGQVTGLLQG